MAEVRWGEAKWYAATTVSLNDDGTVRVKFTSSGYFSDDLRKAAEAEVGAGTNLLAEFDGKVGVPPGAVTAEAAAAATEAVTAEAAPASAEAAPATAVTGKEVTAEAGAAEPRVWLHVCRQSVHATGSPGPWCVACQGKVHSEEHCC